MPKIFQSYNSKPIELATYNDFFIAVEEGNIKKINELNFTDDHLVAKNSAGFTPLHIAVLQTNEKMTNWLLDQGSNPNLTDNLNYTPLHLAVLMGLEKIVKRLLNCVEIEICKINIYGQTALQIAASLKHTMIVKSLAEYENMLNANNCASKNSFML